MRCPFCNAEESKVTDSRSSLESNTTRRRRECLKCTRRFTTFETIDLIVQVKKRSGLFEEFQVNKLITGLDLACQHTRISHDKVMELASDITQEIMEMQIKEIDTIMIGEIVMDRLKKLDAVAYVRFACVYKRFKDKDEIINAIDNSEF